MQTNQYGQTYSGNDDFRGWLAGNGYSSLLSFTGNDGRVDPRAQIQTYSYDDPVKTQSAAEAYGNQVRDLYNQWLGGRQAPNTESDGTITTDTATAAAQREADAREARIRQSYTDEINRTNNALNDLEGSLKNKLDQIEGDYNTYKNEQESTYNQQKNTYDNSSRQNMDNLVSNRNTISGNAARSLRSLQRILGAMGAGGNSEALYDIPSIVKSQADKEYSGASKTFSQNQSNLDTDWGNYVNSYENDKKKLEDWHTGQIKTAKQDTEKERINLLNQLSSGYTNRAQYGGELDDGYNSITDRINQANQNIRDLGTYTTPQYNGITAVFKSPELSSYDTGKMNLTTSVGDNNTSGQSLLTVLQDLRKKQENGLGA